MEPTYVAQFSLTPYILALDAILLTCVALLSLWALQDSDEDHWLVRAYQKRRLAGTRLNRMLQLRNIDPAGYSRQVSAAELKRQIAVCHDCEQVDTCERVLKYRPPKDFAFCPNNRAITRVAAAGTQPA